MPKTPRTYQIEAESLTKEFFRMGGTSGIIHLFTGAGKTFVSSMLYKHIVDLSTERAMFIPPANLVEQTAAAIVGEYPELNFGFNRPGLQSNYVPGIGVVKGGINFPDAALIVASAQTLWDRSDQDAKDAQIISDKSWRRNALSQNGLSIAVPHLIEDNDMQSTIHGGVSLRADSLRSVLISERFDEILAHGIPAFVIHDEAHHSIADGTLLTMYRLWNICDVWGIPRTKLIGLTATPIREDGRALLSLYQRIIMSRGLRWAQKNKYAVPFKEPITRVSAETADTKKHAVRDVDDFAERILQAYLEHGESRPFIAALDSVEMSLKSAEYFSTKGLSVAHFDAGGVHISDGKGGMQKLSNKMRQQVVLDFADGKYVGFFNNDVINEGWDLPWVSLLFWGKHTDSTVKMTQTFGRVVRLFSGDNRWPQKNNAAIIDLTGMPLIILPGGTLFGSEVDPYRGVLKPDAVDEEDDYQFEDGVALEDAVQKGEIAGTGNIYSITKVMSKVPGDLYHDEVNGTYSLTVSPTAALFILPPDWATAKHLRHVVLELEQFASAPNSDTLKIINTSKINITAWSGEETKAEIAYLRYAIELFGQFTLWHCQTTGNHDWGLKKIYWTSPAGDAVPTWVASSTELPTIMGDSLIYTFETIPDAVNQFVKKGQTWKRRPMSASQASLLGGLCRRFNRPFNPQGDWTQGDASKMINHLTCYPLAGQEARKIYQRIARYLL